MKKYTTYKPSGIDWIGDIPEHWDLIKLKYEYKIQKGTLPKLVFDEYREGLIPYLSMDVLRGSETTSFIKQDDGVFIKNNQILILWDGSNSGEIIKVKNEGILSSTMGVLNKVGNRLIEDFSYYQLKSVEPEIRNNTNGMGIPHVDGLYVRNLSLFVPPIPEQHQIVQFLDEKTEIVDKLISTKERKIDLLKEQRTSLINQVITKGLDPDVEMKDSGVEWIGEIPEHWEVGRLVRFTLDHRQGYYSSEEYDDDGFRVVRITDIIENNKVVIENSPFYRLDKENEERYRLEKGDFLFQRTGSHKKIGVFESDEPSIYGSFLIRFRFSKRINHKFLLHFLNSISYQHQINEQIHGGVNPNIHVENIKVCYTTIPSYDEQNEIVEYLDKQTKEIDDLVSLEQKKVEVLKEYRQSLISEVITGKIDVRTNVN